jgi:RimJ/RimL family protein N-acetyltransferase
MGSGTPGLTVTDAGDRTNRDESGKYPDDLVGAVETTTGTRLLVRPIRSDDGERLVAFHESLSPHSVYQRYFTLHPHLSSTEVEHYTHVDYKDRFALVAELGSKIVAVARYERILPPTEAEVAFLVADELQHQGIATVLLRRLADVARTRGVRTFVAETLAENRDMLDVFLKSGFRVTRSSEYGTVSVRFPIVPEDRAAG